MEYPKYVVVMIEPMVKAWYFEGSEESGIFYQGLRAKYGDKLIAHTTAPRRP